MSLPLTSFHGDSGRAHRRSRRLIESDFTFERADRAPEEMKAGGAEYLPPNTVHRGMNRGDTPVKLFVMRIKPKDKPLVLEVRAPH
jgi:hypothetical protein